MYVESRLQRAYSQVIKNQAVCSELYKKSLILYNSCSEGSGGVPVLQIRNVFRSALRWTGESETAQTQSPLSDRAKMALN